MCAMMYRCVCLRVHLFYPSELQCHVPDWLRGKARETTCVKCFRSLMGPDVTRGEVSGTEESGEGLSETWAAG